MSSAEEPSRDGSRGDLAAAWVDEDTQRLCLPDLQVLVVSGPGFAEVFVASRVVAVVVVVASAAVAAEASEAVAAILARDVTGAMGHHLVLGTNEETVIG